MRLLDFIRKLRGRAQKRKPEPMQDHDEIEKPEFGVWSCSQRGLMSHWEDSVFDDELEDVEGGEQ